MSGLLGKGAICHDDSSLVEDPPENQGLLLSWGKPLLSGVRYIDNFCLLHNLAITRMTASILAGCRDEFKNGVRS